MISNFYQECAAERFNGIDFENFFIWGDKSVTSLKNPDCESPCISSDVDNNYEDIECSNIKE